MSKRQKPNWVRPRRPLVLRRVSPPPPPLATDDELAEFFSYEDRRGAHPFNYYDAPIRGRLAQDDAEREFLDYLDELSNRHVEIIRPAPYQPVDTEERLIRWQKKYGYMLHKKGLGPNPYLKEE